MKGVQIMDARQTALEAAKDLVAMNRDLISQIRHAHSLADKYRQYIEFAGSVSNGATLHARASFELFKKAQTLVAVACSALDEAGETTLAEKLRSDLREAIDTALTEAGLEGKPH